MNLGLDKIRIDGGTQSRQKIDQNVVARYADMILDGAKFPPVVAFYDGEEYWLADGFHRYFANKRINSPSIEVIAHDGSVRDAILYGFSANINHGLPPTYEDKRNAVLLMLNDIEWQDMSNRQIAKICGVSHTFVNDLRTQLNNKKAPSGSASTTKKTTTAPTPDPVAEFSKAEVEREQLIAAAENLKKENEDLKDQLTVAQAASTDDIEKEKAQSIIKDLRAQIRVLEIELKAVTTSRDQFQRENAQLMKQVAMQQKKLKKYEDK